MRIDNEPHRDIEPERLEQVAKLVKGPTMLVRGGASDVVTDAGVEHMLQLIPHAQVFDVNGAGHMVAGDDNDVFATALTQFIEEVG
jgi:pimeloyl-ACP methyl ester carboxylesterase